MKMTDAPLRLGQRPLASTQNDMICGAEIMCRALAAENVEFVFGYPGGAVLVIYDEIFKTKQVFHILVRHEQAAVHAADA